MITKCIIRSVAYQLYKSDWIRSHITADRELYEICNYWENIKFDLDTQGYSSVGDFEDYVEENGYSGELYACYEEFIGAEYLDEDYMLNLLSKSDELMELYKADIKDIKKEA